MSTSELDTPAQPQQPDAPEDRGFLIRGERYPWPMPFKMTDPLVIADLVGCDWSDFEARAYGEDEDEDESDATPSNVSDEALFAGLAALAIAHAHPSWARRAVIALAQSIGEEEVEIFGFDDLVPTNAPSTTEPDPSPNTGIEVAPGTTESGGPQA